MQRNNIVLSIKNGRQIFACYISYTHICICIHTYIMFYDQGKGYLGDGHESSNWVFLINVAFRLNNRDERGRRMNHVKSNEALS